MHFLFPLLLFLGIFANNSVFAWDLSGSKSDLLISSAQKAYQDRDELTLTKDTQELEMQNNLLAPYAEYWLMLLKLSKSDNAAVQDFITKYQDFPFAERIRIEWLKILGSRRDWDDFFMGIQKVKQMDVTLRCYALIGRAETGDKIALAEGKDIWMSPNEQPSNCGELFDLMQKEKILEESDLWTRFRLALRENNVLLAKSIAQRIPKFENTNLKLVDRIYKNPRLILDGKISSNKSKLDKELILYALDRLTLTQPDYTLVTWGKLESGFGLNDQNYFWGRLALHAARRHDLSALSLFEKVNPTYLDNEEMAWKVRAALREKNWSLVEQTINEMPVSLQEESVWRYWKGRALKEQQKIPLANAILVPLSSEQSYYGLLAQEELGDVIGSFPSNYEPSEDDVSIIRNIPAIQRSIELQRVNLRWESKSEWNMAIRDFDDRKLLTAAYIALGQGWYDVAISTAEKTKFMHNFELRYPTPYRDVIHIFSLEQNVDEAWIYGLARQESRFINYARSGAGAVGLMQIMPSTAAWAAKRLGLLGYRKDMINQLEVNIRIGTYYLKYISDLMNGQPALATAAYNAGPNRAKKWASGPAEEGAIYAETIPIEETRLYVQKVLANTYFYANRMGGKVISLKQRLGVINGDNSTIQVEDTDN